LTADGRFRVEGVEASMVDGKIHLVIDPSTVVHVGEKGTRYVARMPGSAILPGGLRLQLGAWYPGTRGPKPAV
jgi:hypothetical protein